MYVEPEFQKPTVDSKVTLRKVTGDTVGIICRLSVAKEDEDFIASNGISIAEAHFWPEIAWFRAIYADETPVGFIMFHVEPEKDMFFLWRFMVDRHFKGMGFSRKALELGIDFIRTHPTKALYTSYIEREGDPGGFYEKAGFARTDDITVEGEVALKLEL